MIAPAQVEKALQLAVHCDGVTKTYGHGPAAVHALRGVDMEVLTGELLMLVGPSGCGKTTLISLIAGVFHRDGGDCVVLGHDYNQMAPDDTTRFRGKNIGFVFQAFNLIPALTAAENVITPLIINGVKPRAGVDQAREVLQKVSFDDRMMHSMAFAGVGLSVFVVVRGSKTITPAPPVSEAPQPPYRAFVAGAGIVQASTENLCIGTQIAGIVAKIYVQVGSDVKAGDPLFTIGDRANRPPSPSAKRLFRLRKPISQTRLTNWHSVPKHLQQKRNGIGQKRRSGGAVSAVD